MSGGERADVTLLHDAPSGHLVSWREAHYDRGREGPQRWTEVLFRLGGTPEEVAAAADADWVAAAAAGLAHAHL